MKAGIEWAKVNFSKMNQVQLADAHGVSDKTIRRWQKEGGLPRNKDGTYSLPDTIAWCLNAWHPDYRTMDMYRGSRFAEQRGRSH